MVTIKEVLTKKELKAFVLFPWEVYKNDKNWVPPLIGETYKLLDRKTSPFFEFGEAIYFLAYRDKKVVGRITAQINHNHNDYKKVKEGFFGFYECLPDEEAAMALIKAAEDWIKAKGMTKIIGPESFTIYDETCFLVEGWEADPPTPVVMTMYTPSYYMDHMEKAGYAKEIDWLAYMLYRDLQIRPAFLKMKDRLVQRRGFTFRQINFKKIDEDLPKIKEIFNDAWDENWGHVPLTDRQFEMFKDALIHIADPNLCIMIEDQGKPVGCTVYLPDINPSVKKMNGRLFPLGWLHFLRSKKKATGFRGFLTGVAKDYRNIGVDVVLFMEAYQTALRQGYYYGECSLMVETNHAMIGTVEKWGGKFTKRWRLYSKDL